MLNSKEVQHAPSNSLSAAYQANARPPSNAKLYILFVEEDGMTRSRKRFRKHSMFICADRLRCRRRRIANRILKQIRVALRTVHFSDPATRLVTCCLQAPKVFTIWGSREQRDEMLRFLSDIKRAVLLENRRVYIDFSRTTKMMSDGTLLFYALLDRIVCKVKPRKMIDCSYPNDAIVEQVLLHLNFFRLLGKQARSPVDHRTVKHWCAASGTKVEGEKVAFVADYEGTITSELITSKLYSGLVEAMTNCGHHAYNDVSYAGEEPRWWMFSQELDGHLTIAFCDLGMGIPKSVRTSGKWPLEFVDRVFALIGLKKRIGLKHRPDGSLIRAALELGGSQTGQLHRGKGLPEIKNVLEKQGRGKMWILSGSGGYRYEPAKRVEAIRNFTNNIPGTLIFWDIPLLHETNNE